jgi:hypothetical protein
MPEGIACTSSSSTNTCSGIRQAMRERERERERDQREVPDLEDVAGLRIDLVVEGKPPAGRHVREGELERRVHRAAEEARVHVIAAQPPSEPARALALAARREAGRPRVCVASRKSGRAGEGRERRTCVAGREEAEEGHGGGTRGRQFALARRVVQVLPGLARHAAAPLRVRPSEGRARLQAGEVSLMPATSRRNGEGGEGGSPRRARRCLPGWRTRGGACICPG